MKGRAAFGMSVIGALLLLAATTLSMPGCGGPPCRANKVCTCDGSEAKSHACPGGNCVFPCNGSGTCNLTCAKGGCIAESNQSNTATLKCSGGNCEFLASSGTATLDCPGNGCKMVCTGSATCQITNCTKNCVLNCMGRGSCSQTCKDPSCTTTKLQ